MQLRKWLIKAACRTRNLKGFMANKFDELFIKDFKEYVEIKEFAKSVV